MTPFEIKELCIAGADAYYEYLSRKHRGIEIISIEKAEPVEHKRENAFKLSLSGRIFDLEYVYIEFYKKPIGRSQYEFIEYDRVGKQLIIAAYGDFRKHLMNLTEDDLSHLKIISDLKCLVRRVRDWYKQFGEMVSFEKEPSIIKPEELTFNKNEASPEQLKVLNTIFENGVSYIWGAPGTGKTRYILANALLKYIEKDLKVLVTAPTNNALEQSLNGVLDVLNSKNIPENTIVRLGVPSVEFARKHPSCCVEQEVAKKRKELNQTIKQCNAKLKALRHKRAYEYVRDFSLPMVTLFLTLNEKVDAETKKKLENDKSREKISEKITLCRVDKQKLESHVSTLESENDRHKAAMRRLDTSVNFLSQDVIRELRSKIAENDSIIAQERDEIYKIELNIEKLKAEREQTNEEYDSCVIAENEAKKKLDDKIEKAKNTNVPPKYYEKIYLNETKRELEETLHREETLFRQSSVLLRPTDNEEYLEKCKSDAQQALDQLSQNMLKTMIDRANVIAITIDGYHNKFAPSEESDPSLYNTKAEISHIFLDEAAYCCLIKGTSLFANKCSITFLGDHMQLPPVCETDIDEMKKTQEDKKIVLWAQSAIAAESMFYDEFERIFFKYDNNHPIGFQRMVKSDLTSTFRFGAELSAVLNEYVYKNGFKSSGTGATEIILLSTRSEHNNSSRENIAEVNSINKYIRENKPRDYAVLTPYKNQVKALKNVIHIARDEQRIMTIHASQGREWDTVILSVVDTSNKWFTNSIAMKSNGLRVINTAVSRAKRRLVIVCDERYWKNERKQLIGSLVRIAGKHIE